MTVEQTCPSSPPSPRATDVTSPSTGSMQPACAAPKTLRLPQVPACFAYASVVLRQVMGYVPRVNSRASCGPG